MNRLGTELLGFITDFFRVIFTPRAFLDSLATRSRSRWRGWGVGVVYLAAPLIVIFPFLGNESLASIATLALVMVSYPALSALILVTVGGKLAPDPKQGREMALYSLAPLGLITGFVAQMLVSLTSNRYLWFWGFSEQVGTQDILALFPYWASENPVIYMVGTVLYSLLTTLLGLNDSPYPNQPGFLWGFIGSGNVLFSLAVLPLVFWQRYFLKEAARVLGGDNRVVTRFWLISGVVGLVAGLVMVFFAGVFLAP